MARVLIIEDEPLIAMMLEDYLEALDHQAAGCADNVSEGLARVGNGGFDCAILDVRLRDGETSWPVADALDDAGLPFVFASGGQVEPPPPRHAARAFLHKPYTMEGVRTAIDGVLQPD